MQGCEQKPTYRALPRSCTKRPSKSVKQQLQGRSEKRKEQKMVVNVVEAGIVGRDIASAASRSGFDICEKGHSNLLVAEGGWSALVGFRK